MKEFNANVLLLIVHVDNKHNFLEVNATDKLNVNQVAPVTGIADLMQLQLMEWNSHFNTSQ